MGWWLDVVCSSDVWIRQKWFLKSNSPYPGTQTSTVIHVTLVYCWRSSERLDVVLAWGLRVNIMSGYFLVRSVTRNGMWRKVNGIWRKVISPLENTIYRPRSTKEKPKRNESVNTLLLHCSAKQPWIGIMSVRITTGWEWNAHNISTCIWQKSVETLEYTVIKVKSMLVIWRWILAGTDRCRRLTTSCVSPEDLSSQFSLHRVQTKPGHIIRSCRCRNRSHFRCDNKCVRIPSSLAWGREVPFGADADACYRVGDEIVLTEDDGKFAILHNLRGRSGGRGSQQ